MTDTNAHDYAQNRPWHRVYDAQGYVHSIQIPEMTLIDHLEEAVAAHGDQTAYVCMGASISFKELDLYSRQIATYLQRLGLQKGDKVAVMLPNILQYPICALGVIRAGCVLVNVNPLYTASELHHQLQDSKAQAVFILENFAHVFQKMPNRANVRHVVIAKMGDLLGRIKGTLVNLALKHIKKMVPAYDIEGAKTFRHALDEVSASKYVRPDLNSNDLVILQYTGGTTGTPKGAMLSHQNILANCAQYTVFFDDVFAPDERMYEQYAVVALPLYHIFSFATGLVLLLKRGYAGLLIPNPRDLDGLVKALDAYQPVFFPAVNTLFNALAHHARFCTLDHTRLRLSLGGGMSILPTTAKAWHDLTGNWIVEGYGLSETSPVLTLNPPNHFSGTIGIPLPSTDLKLIDEAGNAHPTQGEICVKGPQVMAGYWQNPEATAQAFTADGYFKTGDIGKMDEAGYTRIIDRKKDMILVSGFNVYPNEVETAMTHHPKILECGVCGVPDEKSGEAVKIYIVKKDDSLSAKEVKAFAKEHLTGYKRPRHIAFVEELPKTNVGKILRKDLISLDALSTTQTH